MKYLLSLLVLWIVSGILTYGMINAQQRYFSNCEIGGLKDDWRDSSGFTIFVSAAAPMGTVAALLITNFAQHGLDYTFWPAEGEEWAGCK